MQEYKKPLFQKGRVLKKEGLEALWDFPSGLASTMMAGWHDGILSGFGISYTMEDNGKGQLIVEAGAVLHKGQVVLAGKEVFPFDAFDRQIVVRLYILPGYPADDFYIWPLEVRIEEIEDSTEEGLELGRFRLSHGAHLRKEYQDMQDFHTAYNTLDITNVQYAGPGGATVPPVMLQVFARMVIANKAAGEADISFALMCLGQAPVPRECILWYISRRLGTPYREMGHNEIYESLVRIAGTGSRGADRGQRKDGPAVF